MDQDHYIYLILKIFILKDTFSCGFHKCDEMEDNRKYIERIFYLR
jgi:hypothetical protein